MKLERLGAALLGLGALLTFSVSPEADTKIFHVPMSGAQEVPPSGSAGTGSCQVVLDDVTGSVTVSGTYSGLTGNATASHIHIAPAGVNGGVILGLTQTGGTSGTITGGGTLTAPQVSAMLAGGTYVNLHTTFAPGGEIRGQIVTLVPGMPGVYVGALVVLALAGGAFVLTRRGGAGVV